MSKGCAECGGTRIVTICGQEEVYCVRCDEWVLTNDIISANIYPTKPTKRLKDNETSI